MFPLYDSSEKSSFPFMNYLLIGINILVFFLQMSASSFDRFILEYAFIPAEFSVADPSSYFYILSSMFMHGSLLHIGSNLWFLHIFGDNVEDRMGHMKYLFFYLAAGVAATLAQYFLNTESTIPLVGASGAISGVSGAYLLLFHNSRIRALVPLGFYMRTMELPAWFFLGYWFLIQVFSGFSTYEAVTSGDGGGVAYAAHIGGFVFGLIVAPLLRKRSSPDGII